MASFKFLDFFKGLNSIASKAEEPEMLVDGKRLQPRLDFIVAHFYLKSILLVVVVF